MKYGLLGEKLGHSISPEIHKIYGNNDYELMEVPRHEVAAFVKAKNYLGLNVTIPYKETVLPLCDELSPRAEKIGSVNTIIVRKDGSLYGENTDYLGFLYMAKEAGISLSGKKVILMGSGGTGKMAKVAIEDSNAKEVVQLSRSNGVKYEDKAAYLDGEILINTTPVGMYPKNGETPVDLKEFTNLEGVLDVIYNPLRTELLLAAEELGIPCSGGLAMLAEQGRCGTELFLNKKIPPELGDEAYRKVRQQLANIVVIDNEAAALAIGEELQRKVVASGDWQEIGKERSLVLSITKEESKIHYKALRQNGVLFPTKVLKWGSAAKIDEILRSL